MDTEIVRQLNAWKSRSTDDKKSSIKIDDKYYTLPGHYEEGAYTGHMYRPNHIYIYTNGTGQEHYTSDGYVVKFNWCVKDDLIIREHTSVRCFGDIQVDSIHLTSIEKDAFKFNKVYCDKTKSDYLCIQFGVKQFCRRL